MQRQVDAAAASCKCGTGTSGTAGRCQCPGPVAEANEECSRPLLQLSSHSFDSSKAQQGSTGLQEHNTVDHRHFGPILQGPSAYVVKTGHTGTTVQWSAVALTKEYGAASSPASGRIGVSIDACAALATKNSCSTESAALMAYGSSTSSSSSSAVHSAISPTDKGMIDGVKGWNTVQRHTSTKPSLTLAASAADGPFHPTAAEPLMPLRTTAVLPPSSAVAAAAEARPLPACEITPHLLWPYIQQYGQSIMSISTLQEGLQFFMFPGVGYMAYSLMTNGLEWMNIFTPVVLGDPLCHPSNYRLIASAFLKQHPGAMFLQISKSFAYVLRGLGMLINSVGGETQLDLTKYTFSGYAKRGLRSAISSAVKEGVVVEEVMHSHMHSSTQLPPSPAAAAAADKVTAVPAGWSGIASEMAEVDKRWLGNKGRRAGRVWFLNRAPVFSPEPGVRKFVARDGNGRMLAFVFFDAVYMDGLIVGYYANVTRMRPDAHPGVLNLIIKTFIDRVRSESHLAVPTTSVSLKKSQRKKQRQQEEAAAAAAESTQKSHAAATSAKSALPARPSSSAHNSSSSSSTGPSFLSLGLSPLYQMIDGDPFSHSRFIRRLFEFSFQQGSGYYPFDTLAAAKAKYGAGLHDGVYDDPNVTYKQVYLAHRCRHYACMKMFDLGRMLGFWRSPGDAAVAFSGHKINDGLKLLKQMMRQLQASKLSSGKGLAATPHVSSKSSSKGSKSDSCRSDASSSSSSMSAAGADADAVVHSTAGSNSAESHDSHEKGKRQCLMFNRGREHQCCLLTALKSAAARAVSAANIRTEDNAADGRPPVKQSSSTSRSNKPRLCVCKISRVLLPMLQPLKPQPALSSAAAATTTLGGSVCKLCQAANSCKVAKAVAAGAVPSAQKKHARNCSSFDSTESSGSECIGAGSGAGGSSLELSSSVTSDSADSNGTTATAAK